MKLKFNLLSKKKKKKIGKYCFSFCTALKEILNSIIEIDIQTFDNCSGLEKIEIPSSVKEIKKRVFVFVHH